ncbi:MAG: dehypoxanthine futalosine cyclase [Desulfobacula sp.]|jgi:cyclic dehypoxanthinyl futalosine synthase|uniref:cyclic dehypoxanthinyl futalosine synthase n=1 Tax=Desulfobacula sp. TaxID=2593537 RepID=UPI001D9A1275|nr:dehypoxanthine futalosine cyclase [Desulfobacula sp.]MBT3485806.1 dehypoxanthine futalosine cyclase [Desulfobacula sp.]MBT3807661.1 dehypoxanthine futalosine cyclase [Desulfobacula sp.]MBT4027290.1 dehypoxanthine futalosine cyclase [Desulfobacula sp.]MBT4200966.1 dehypoxanthine futalosine cyclase [Desulfobacula sp.]
MDNLQIIIEKILARERIDINEGLALFRQADLLTLASLANRKRFYYHPDKVITYVVDRNINYTNICASGCRFCAFFVTKDMVNGYIISKQDLFDKIAETIDLGGTQILLQGGMHPDLEIDYYTDLLTCIKDNFDIHIHGFSPPEIDFIAKKSSLSIAQTLSILKEAGLSSVPGGGAEILCDDIRQKISPDKCSSEEWLEVMRQAHKQGMRSSATMMFGHVEKDHHIFEHMDKLRRLQDETHGFTAFIPWTFQPDNTKISVKKKTSVEYLKVLAMSRLFFDNIDNIQASWVTQGDKIAQTALFFGANDMGSTMIEENVVASAGVDFMLPKEELIRLITRAGFEPCQRDCYYNLL